MKLRLRVLPLVMLLWVGGPTDPNGIPVAPERLTIQSQALVLDPDNPARVRVGSVVLVGGWRLTSASQQFGGWSALWVDGDRLIALSDSAAILTARIGAYGRLSGAAIHRIPPGCGTQEDKLQRDTESLAHDPASGDWWIGYEWRNAICRVSADFSVARGLAVPHDMAKWRRTKGPETMLRLPDGRFLVFAEADPDYGPTFPLLLFDRDPTDPGARVTPLRYKPPEGYNPTDAALLPDGRVVVINRRFSWRLFTSVLATFDLAAVKPGAVISPRIIARFEPPLISDNFEGLSVTVEAGRPYLWMISDDNFMGWEATYLLKLSVDPRPDAKPPKTVRAE